VNRRKLREKFICYVIAVPRKISLWDDVDVRADVTR